MGDSFGKIPNITGLKDFSCKTAILIDPSQEQGAIVDKPPLSLYEINISDDSDHELEGLLTTLCQ